MKVSYTIVAFCALLMFGFCSVKAQSNPTITLNHIAVHVKDLPVSRNFYGSVLQLREIPEPFKDGKHIWYSIGQGSQLHLIEKAEEALVVPGKTSHLCFSVTSLDDFIENLDSHKIEYTNWPGTAKAPTVRTDGVKQIYFQDPDGYWIEVNDDFEKNGQGSKK